MSLNTYRHTEAGEHYVIEVPMDFSGKRLGVQFVGGKGRTKYRQKAREFDERWGYEVTMPEGVEPWVNAESKKPATGEDWVNEGSVAVALEDEDPGYEAELPQEVLPNGDLDRPD